MAAAAGGAGMQGGIRKSWEHGARTVWWTAADPDGDALTYRLDLQRDGDDAWLPLARDVSDTFHVWDARGLPDGLYRVRVTADDARDNPAGEARTDDRVTPVFAVDNTRPAVSDVRVERNGRGWDVRFTARDPGGRVAAVEVAIGGSDFRPVVPVDGVADSASEPYELRVDAPADGDAAAVRVRVVDAAGNVGGDLRSLD
jgi:hypothetical protein